MSAVKGLLLVAVLAVAVPAWAGDNNNANGENRCDDLGSVCLCAESLDESTSFIPTDLSNPPSSTSKQCHGGAAIGMGQTAPGRTRFASETLMPTGNAVTNTLQVDDSYWAISVELVGTTPSTFSNGTLCIRDYQRIDPAIVAGYTGYAALGLGDRLKTSEMLINNQCLQQDQWSPSGGGAGAAFYPVLQLSGSDCQPGFPNGSPGGDIRTTGTTLTLGDCSNNWCRMESCITLISGQLTTRQRVTRITPADGSAMVKSEGPFPVSTITINSDDFWIGSFYTQHDDTAHATGGHRYASYGMAAFWPTPQSDTVWIGPATEVENGASTFDVLLDCNPNSGPAGPLVGVRCTADLGHEGTGPDYRFKYDCNDDGVFEDTIDVNDDATPVAPQTSGVDKCDAIYANANNYTARVVVEDYANQGAGVGTPVATTSATDTVVVQAGSASQCPVTAQAAILRAQLWNATGSGASTIIDSDFKSGDTILSANRQCVALEAVGNDYLTLGSPGSVGFVLDGMFTCESTSQFVRNADNGLNDFNCDVEAGSISGGVNTTHQLVMTPYDLDGCTGTSGPPLSISYTALAP